MESGFLQNIGYKVETKLSAIKPAAHWLPISAHEGNHVLLPIAAIEASLEKLTGPLRKDAENGLPNPFLLGYQFAEKGVDPTIDEVWNNIASDPINTGIKRLVETWARRPEQKGIKTGVIGEITTYFENASSGYGLLDSIAPLKRKLAIIERSKDFFYGRQAQTSDFDHLIEAVNLLYEMTYMLEDTIVKIVNKRQLIDQMKTSFEQTITPDRKRTIEDQIDTIKTKLTKDHSPFDTFVNPYNEGYLMAIRGQDQPIIDLLESKLYYKSYHGFYGIRIGTGYAEASFEKISMWVNSVLEGYALSYYMAYLENQLAEFSKPADTFNQKMTEASLAPKLKWNGQKNQLYEVLRKLKEKELLTNSYEDLAVFIKAHVDVFIDTELSTILKQISRPQKLPKSRRIDLDK